MNTLEQNSGILYLKSKFFLIRVVTYFSFLLLPVWIQKSLHLSPALQGGMMVFYILFLTSQWFLLGKEIDHRLKIYFRVNSSIDRVVYRLHLGMVFFVLYFNMLSFLPSKWIYNCFWVTWVLLGLFYSWPTRGKIIKESVTTNFTEFRYLDSFEKTLVALIVLLFVFSIPELPTLTNSAALKLFFDPLERFSSHYWDFLIVNYYPFYKYPELLKIAWSLHFYFVGIGLFLLTFYALLRFFVSRRLSLLGVFALISSWSFSKILAANYGYSIATTYSLIWVWTLLWVAKSETYRAGLFLGIIGYLGAIINQSWSFLVLIQLFLTYFFFLKEKSAWYKKQLTKYAIFGMVFTLLVLLTHYGSFSNLMRLDVNYLHEVMRIFDRKAFFSLSFFGVIILILKLSSKNFPLIKNLKFDDFRIYQFLICIFALLFYGFVFDKSLVSSFSIMWPITLLSLVPLELLFQSISRLRSSRNMIYLIYILICLLDSHFEGRVKIFLKLFSE